MIRQLLFRLIRSFETKLHLMQRYEIRAMEKLLRSKKIYNYVELERLR